MVNTDLCYYFLDSSAKGIFFGGHFIWSWSPGCWIHWRSHKSLIFLSHSHQVGLKQLSFGLGIKGLDFGWEITGQWPCIFTD